MSIEQQLDLCSRQYKRWKELALKANDIMEIKQCLEKAMFWLELNSAFMTLWSIEQVRGEDPTVQENISKAKANLSRKLADYAKDILDEIQ